jgi:hypothetical protein
VLPFEAVLAGLEGALGVGSVDPAVVVVEARRATERRSAIPTALPNLARFDRPAPVLDGYDKLLKGSA